MASMQELVNGVLTELQFGSGQDVQIHLQPSIVQVISRLYRTLMKKYVFRDYYSTTSLVVSAVDGQVTSSITSILTKFSNIIGVFEENSSTPLPFLPVMANPNTARRMGLVPSGNEKIFTIWPKQDRNIILIAKYFSEEDFSIDDEDVPFYPDLLILGAAYKQCLKSGINKELCDQLRSEFEQLLDTYVKQELQNIQMNPYRGSYPTDWYVDET